MSSPPHPSPNQTPLSPLRFLERSAAVFPDRVAVIQDERSFTYREFGEQVATLARAIRRRIEPGDRIAFLSPNAAELCSHTSRSRLRAACSSRSTLGSARRRCRTSSSTAGVMHPDGYVQLKDRAKDIIISGGENISTSKGEKRNRKRLAEVGAVTMTGSIQASLSRRRRRHVKDPAAVRGHEQRADRWPAGLRDPHRQSRRGLRDLGRHRHPHSTGCVLPPGPSTEVPPSSGRVPW